MEVQEYKDLIVAQIKGIYTNLFDETDKIIAQDDELKSAEKISFQFINPNVNTNPGVFKLFYEGGKRDQLSAASGYEHLVINDIESEPMDGWIRADLLDLDEGMRGVTIDLESISDIDGSGEPIRKSLYEHLEGYERKLKDLVPLKAFYDGKPKYFNNKVSQEWKKIDERSAKEADEFNKRHGYR